MQDQPFISTPSLEEIYLIPVEMADATATPILDETGNLLRDEDGLPIYEG